MFRFHKNKQGIFEVLLQTLIHSMEAMEFCSKVLSRFANQPTVRDVNEPCIKDTKHLLNDTRDAYKTVFWSHKSLF